MGKVYYGRGFFVGRKGKDGMVAFVDRKPRVEETFGGVTMSKALSVGGVQCGRVVRVGETEKPQRTAAPKPKTEGAVEARVGEAIVIPAEKPAVETVTVELKVVDGGIGKTHPEAEDEGSVIPVPEGWLGLPKENVVGSVSVEMEATPADSSGRIASEVVTSGSMVETEKRLAEYLGAAEVAKEKADAKSEGKRKRNSRKQRRAEARARQMDLAATANGEAATAAE